MDWFILGIVVLLVNIAFGINHWRKQETNFSAAFSWFVVGFMIPTLIIQIPSL